MGYLGRRIGKSQNQGDSNPGGANGAVGGGILDLFAQGYFKRQGNISNISASGTGHVASGGVIGEYSDGGTVYRSHIFNSTGTFEISSVGTIESTVDVLLIAGDGSLPKCTSTCVAGDMQIGRAHV